MKWSLVVLTMTFFVAPAFSQPAGPVSEGIRQYQAGNYERGR